MSHNLKSLYSICIKEKLIPNDTTYKQFFEVLNEYHRGISEAIIKGYSHSPNGQLGNFKILKDIRRRKTINWGESNKLKQNIIDTGGTPYNKETAPHGDMWFVLFEDNEYFKWIWDKTTPVKFVKNSKYYVFRACTKNRRTVGKVIKENEFITDKYDTYK